MLLFRLFLVIFISISSTNLLGIFATNFFRSWDINLRPPQWCGETFQWTTWTEIGLKSRGYDPEGKETNVLKMWTPDQDALAMFRGFDDSSPFTQFLVNTLGNPEDDGVRGHFDVKGKFKAREFGIAGRYHAPHNITVGLFLPIYEMRLRHVQFIDQTRDVTAQDIVVKENLTNNFIDVIRAFDPSLKLHGWEKMGFGDLTFLAEWYRNFPQGKPILKNVSLCARMGLSFPTGVKRDIDEILSVPFGLESAGLIFGGGIDLTWFNVFRGGIDIEFIHLFGNLQEQRIKVNPSQSDFLLFAKAKAHRDFGFTQRFNLYLEAYRIVHGLSVRATYQFWKHGDDTLSLCTNQFSNEIANTAQSLQEWTMHHAIFSIIYDFQCDVDQASLFKPQLSIFYKFPFNGERALLTNTVGATFTLNF